MPILLIKIKKINAKALRAYGPNIYTVVVGVGVYR